MENGALGWENHIYCRIFLGEFGCELALGLGIGYKMVISQNRRTLVRELSYFGIAIPFGKSLNGSFLK